MAGLIDELMQRYGPDIQEAIGNVEDLQRFSSFKDASKYLSGKRQQRESVQRMGDILNRLESVDLNQVPLEKNVEQVDINTNHPDFIAPELSQNEAVKQWGAYKKRFEEKNEDGSPKIQGEPMDFKSFLNYYPELAGTLPEQYYTKSNQTVEMTPEEQKIAAYKLAGLNDEDIAWYEQNKKTVQSRDEYNQMVKGYLDQIIPQVQSRYGKMGDVYAKQLLSQGTDMIIPEPVAKSKDWVFEYKDGKMIKMNKATGNYSITDLEPGVKSDPKNWNIFIDEDGSVTGTKGLPYWGERIQTKDGGWKIDYRDVLNKQETDDWQADNDKRDKTGVYTPKTTSSRRSGSRGPRSFSMKKMDVNEVKKIKPSDIGTKYKTVEQLDELQRNDDYLTEETKNAIKDYLKQGPETDYADDSNDGTIKYFEDYTLQLDEAYNAELKGQTYQGMTYEQWKQMFLADLKKYGGQLSKKDYEYYYNSYK